MDVKHGPDRGAGNPADDGDGFFQSLHHIALIDGQRFDQHRDAARGGVRSHRGESVDVVARGFFASQSAGGAALFGRSEDQDTGGPEIGAKVDEVADVFPTALAEGRVGSADVQSLGADHEPVQADKGEAFFGDDAAAFRALGGCDLGGAFGQCKRRDFNARVTRGADGAAGVRKGKLLECLVADGVTEGHELTV